MRKAAKAVCMHVRERETRRRASSALALRLCLKQSFKAPAAIRPSARAPFATRALAVVSCVNLSLSLYEWQERAAAADFVARFNLQELLRVEERE